MSSSDPQKSPVHHATEDSSAEATNPNQASGRAGTGDAMPVGASGPDRQKRSPDAVGSQASHRADAVQRDDTRIGKDPDDSTYGGPLRIDDPAGQA